MAKVERVLIVGGGIAGMSTAIVLRRADIAVDLIDIDPDWRVYGAGITITGPTLRAFDQLGILDEVMAEGYTGSGIKVCATTGEQIALLPTPMPPDSHVPGSGGIMRPLLHRILAHRVRQSGATVRLGVTVDGIETRDGAASVAFSDGGTGSYDLVIGADGIFSKVRSLILPDAPQPAYTGQCCWRLARPRLPEIDRRHFFLGGPHKVGLNPVSPDEMYMFLLERVEAPQWQEGPTAHLRLAELLRAYGGPLAQIREELDEQSQIVFRPLETLDLPAPWFKGRTLLIGDAAHPTTPQLASGAGMAAEDAIVLGEELASAPDIDTALQQFMARRYERCRLVVNNSIEIGRREQAGAPIDSQTELVEQSLKKLMEPI
jgi:2-polyprenyl-6-methoxyphenol hydroxylase-like FAD-dependent oxidoreductase